MASLGQLLNATEGNSILKNAQWFIDQGIPIVPCKGKTPIGGAYAAKLNTEGIKDGYGIALGNGYIGIDFDTYAGAEGLEEFEGTRKWHSGSGNGYGILFKVPKEFSIYGGVLRKGVTVRAEGSILIGPGSKHPSGGIYRYSETLPILDAPESLQQFLFTKTLEKLKEGNVLIEEAKKPERFFTDIKWKTKLEATDVVDRSDATYTLMWYSAEKGATNEELAWVLNNFKPAIDKYEEHLAKELSRQLNKIRMVHNHPGEPCDKADCPSAPDWMHKEVKIAFWEQRPEFAYIRQAAQSRQVAPKAVLLSVLCRLAAAVPTEVVLPPIVGKTASLNFFACFVGESGGGKGTSTGLAEELFNFRRTGIEFTTQTPGSGEGVVSAYLQVKSNKWEQRYESALINFDEIDNLRAGSDRQGSTLSSTLRQGFMGEQAGGTYSRVVKELKPHSYRMAFQLSAQPLKSAWLLEDSDGGLPQRFVFVSTSDPECPDVDDLPDFPVFSDWRIPNGILELKKAKIEANKPKPKSILGDQLTDDTPQEKTKEFVFLEIDSAIEREIKTNRHTRLKTGKTGTEGHLDLVRLKVAALLAIFDGRLDVNMEDWQLSNIIMNWSKNAVNEIREALAHKSIKEQQSRATQAADRAIHVEKRLETNQMEQTKSKLMEYVKSGTLKYKGSNQIKQKMRRYREHCDEAFELLISEKKIKYDSDNDVISLT